MARLYEKLNFAELKNQSYKIVPIRDEDKYAIMKWRNDQIDILRQNTLLTINQQETYFKNVVDKLFIQEQPEQLLFSFLENDKLIGYGGLVHIDWENKIAEISFLTETSRNKNRDVFISDWVNYLSLIKQVADAYLNFNYIFTYAYDIRPDLYIALERTGFKETQRIENFIEINKELKDVVMHTFYFKALSIRLATKNDVGLYFNWANDPDVRKHSYQQNLINYNDHIKWFDSKINDQNFKFYIFGNDKQQHLGQVRINKSDEETIIGISIDSQHRGLGYGSKMLIQACENYFSMNPSCQITAYIKEDNMASVAIFKKAGFSKQERVSINEVDSIKLILKNERY